MEGRIQRFIIPATMVFITTILVLLVGSDTNPCNSFIDFLSSLGESGLLSFIILVGITNYGLGFICHVIFTWLMFLCEKIRIKESNKLIGIFGFKPEEINDRKKLLREIQAEFHFRFHSRAPGKILKHCSDRNTIWYITKCSAIAMLIGFILGCYIIYITDIFSLNLIRFVVTAIIVTFLVIISWRNGTKWNNEFWNVGMKWLKSDLINNPLSNGYRNWLDQEFKIQKK